MSKLQKKRVIYLIIGVIVLLGFNYKFFNQSFVQSAQVETADEMVARILFKNGIQVTSMPGVYNVKDIEKIDISLNSEMREKVEIYDQILYYKAENLLILYRPSTKSIVNVTTLSK
jgi:hypothetical protein